MVVSERNELRFLNSQFSGHSQMQTEPCLLREAKQHLFSMRARFQKRRVADGLFQCVCINATKDSFRCVKFDGQNFLFQSAVPLFAEKLDFGQFRHSKTYSVAIPVAIL